MYLIFNIIHFQYRICNFRNIILSKSVTIDSDIMSDFIRARSEEQKEQRLAEIKDATDRLFSEHPYHAITLSTIAKELGCSRAQVYKYVSTKEEIFLELCADKRREYLDALMVACPVGCGYSDEVFAEVWSGILNAHQGFLRYCDILMTIIETNVSVERLARFKKSYYDDVDVVISMLSSNLGMSIEEADKLYYQVYFQAVGIGSFCYDNSLVAQALEMARIDRPKPEFRPYMRDYILMCIRSRRA